MGLSPLRERRKKATRWFIIRVCVLLLLIGAIAYSAWFAPWARPARQVRTEVVR